MKITCIILCLFLVTLTTSAQIERQPVVVKTDSAQRAKTADAETKADKQNRRERFKELDLSKEQKIKMKEIMQANKAAKDSIENNTNLSKQDKKMQLRELQESQMQKIQAILTTEQVEKFKASRQNNP